MLEGGVPNGFQERKTKKHATQSNGPKPEKKHMMKLTHRGVPRGGDMWLDPFAIRLLVTASLVSPREVLQFMPSEELLEQ